MRPSGTGLTWPWCFTRGRVAEHHSGGDRRRLNILNRRDHKPPIRPEAAQRIAERLLLGRMIAHQLAVAEYDPAVSVLLHQAGQGLVKSLGFSPDLIVRGHALYVITPRNSRLTVLSISCRAGQRNSRWNATPRLSASSRAEDWGG